MQQTAKRPRFSLKLSAWCFPPGLNVSSGQMLPDIICSNRPSIRPILTCKGWQSDIGMSCFPGWNQMWTTGRFPLDFSIKTHQNHFAVRYWISLPQQLDTTKIARFIAVGCFPLFQLDKYRKNKHSRSAKRPCSAHQNNIQAAAGARAHGAHSPQRCIMSDLQHQLLHVHHPAVLPKNSRSDTRVHASALYVHAWPRAVTSQLGFHILSYTIFSPDAVNAALCSGPVVHYGLRHGSHTIRRVRQKRGSPSDVALRR